MNNSQPYFSLPIIFTEWRGHALWARTNRLSRTIYKSAVVGRRMKAGSQQKPSRGMEEQVVMMNESRKPKATAGGLSRGGRGMGARTDGP